MKGATPSLPLWLILCPTLRWQAPEQPPVSPHAMSLLHLGILCLESPPLQLLPVWQPGSRGRSPPRDARLRGQRLQHKRFFPFTTKQNDASALGAQPAET